MGDIAQRLGAIHQRIERATLAAGRRPTDVRLIAVSKLQSVDAIREAYAAGVRDFGENYVQELVQKSDALVDLPDLRFHLIGHLQTNKVKAVVGIASMVHSVDSVRLAQELGKRCQATELAASKRWPFSFGLGDVTTDRSLPILIEVNVGGESQKSGCCPEEAAEILAYATCPACARSV
jgi:pyridoxal phosphate enzyme (YggS family)